MKITIAVWVVLLLSPSSALAQGARLQIDHLDRLRERATETVNVTIDAAMLKIAGAFMPSGSKEQAAAKEMVNGLQGIYVRTFAFDRDDAYTADDVNAIRKQLAAPGWSRLVTVDSPRDRELVEVHMWREGNSTGGLAIVVAEPRELTVVNIIGPIDLTKLAALQGQLGIPRLPDIAPKGQ